MRTISENAERAGEEYAALSQDDLLLDAYSSAVVLSEFSADGKRCDFHGVDRWCYLGSAKTHADAHRLLLQDTPAKNRFDLDSYKILHRALALGLLTVVP